MFNFGAIGQGIAGTIQAGVGLYNKRRAKKLRRKGEALMNEAWSKRTDYQIPDEIKQNYLTATNEAYSTPAIQRLMEQNANQGLSQNLSAVKKYATSANDALAAAVGANRQYASDVNQAAVAGAEQRQANLNRMYESGNVLADYKSMQWDLNVNVPFLQRMQWAQEMIGSGYQGETAGLNQFVEGNNQIGQSLANFFSMGNSPAAGSGGESGGGGGGGFAGAMAGGSVGG